MCEPIICSLVIGTYVVLGGGFKLVHWYTLERPYNNEQRRTGLIHGLDDLVQEYLTQDEKGSLEINPDADIVFGYLPPQRALRSVILEGNKTRDDILFGSSPPRVREASRYLRAQKTLSKIDERLLFVLDPWLMIAVAQQQPLMMDFDISGCKDGSYSSSMDFVADYRHLVGEETFFRRLDHYLATHGLPEGTQPWYVRRPEYERRVTQGIGTF